MKVLWKVHGLLRPRYTTWATGSRHEEHGSREGLQRAHHADQTGTAVLPGILLRLLTVLT